MPGSLPLRSVGRHSLRAPIWWAVASAGRTRAVTWGVSGGSPGGRVSDESSPDGAAAFCVFSAGCVACGGVIGGVPCAVHALCEKLAVLHHREFGKFRRLKGRH